VPFFADYCMVDLLDEEGALQRAAVAHVDRSKEALVRGLQRRYSCEPVRDRWILRVLDTARSELSTDITAAGLAAAIRDPEHLRGVLELGPRSYIVAPLRARERTLGAISFVLSTSGRRYCPNDVALAEDLPTAVRWRLTTPGCTTLPKQRSRGASEQSRRSNDSAVGAT
jgi:GAF domain-containing protein